MMLQYRELGASLCAQHFVLLSDYEATLPVARHLPPLDLGGPFVDRRHVGLPWRVVINFL